jgi:hypothetical protein
LVEQIGAVDARVLLENAVSENLCHKGTAHNPSCGGRSSHIVQPECHGQKHQRGPRPADPSVPPALISVELRGSPQWRWSEWCAERSFNLSRGEGVMCYEPRRAACVQRPKIIAPPRTSSKHLSTLAPAGRIRTRLAAWRDPPGLGHQALDVAGSGSSWDAVFDQAERPDGVSAGGLDHGRDGGDRHWRELQGAAEARRRVPGVAQRIERQNRGPAGVETLENSLRSFDQLSESEADLNQQLR